MINATDEREQVLVEMRSFVEDNFLYLQPGLELHDTDQLLELGIIDSLGFVELVEEVQTRYAVAVADIDITEQNFGSIVAIAEYVGRKRTE